MTKQREHWLITKTRLRAAVGLLGLALALTSAALTLVPRRCEAKTVEDYWAKFNSQEIECYDLGHECNVIVVVP